MSVLEASNLKEHLVGIGEMFVSNCKDERLAAFALGSCVGLSFYDSVAGVGGMVHCMLPSIDQNSSATEDRPCDFVDFGIKRLLEAMIDIGASPKNIVVCVAGGARHSEGSEISKISARNCRVLRKTLWEVGLLIEAKDIGGESPRTMILDMATGETRLRWRRKEWTLNDHNILES